MGGCRQVILGYKTSSLSSCRTFHPHYKILTRDMKPETLLSNTITDLTHFTASFEVPETLFIANELLAFSIRYSSHHTLKRLRIWYSFPLSTEWVLTLKWFQSSKLLSWNIFSGILNFMEEGSMMGRSGPVDDDNISHQIGFFSLLASWKSPPFHLIWNKKRQSTHVVPPLLRSPCLPLAYSQRLFAWEIDFMSFCVDSAS